MARRALLIGAQTGGLTGVANDVTAMAEALERWGFIAQRCEAEAASRAGILDAYERLIADTRPDDAVFVYYSGHGGFYRPPGYETVVRPRVAMQFIVATDYHESTAGDFRGVTSIELSLLLARLTERTTNVTVALDCCHAAHMSRDPLHVRVKAHAHPAPYDVVVAHLEGLQRQGLRVDPWTPLGNQYAVRIVACAPDQSAYEYTNEAGRRTGILTESLVLALAEAGEVQATWSTVIERVQRRVLTLVPGQRPEAEGPARRLLFDVVEADPVATLPVVAAGQGRVRLDGGPLLGTGIGDEFAVMPSDSTGPDDATKIGDIRIDRLDALAALGTLKLRSPNAAVPLGARAHRTKATAPPFPVRLPAGDPRCAALVSTLTGAVQFRLAEPDEPCPVEVRIDDAGGLTIWDQIGPLHEPRRADLASTGRVVRDLRRLAQATALRCLTEDPQHALTTPVTVEFGLADAGMERPLSNSGAVLYVGQHIYVRVRNDGRQTVYVSLLDIGVSTRITLLNSASPSGVCLDPGKEYVFGWNDLTGVLTGVPLTWPEGLNPSQARPETIVAVITSAPQDFRVFEQEGIRRATRWLRSPLEQIFDQIATGATRDLAGECGPAVRYAVRTINFELVPAPPPESEAVPFQVDERPEPSARLLAPKGGVPMSVAVRLSDLVVHRNRTLDSADIRLDAVVLTGGAGTQPVCRAQTERFRNIRDGDRLPLDRMLVYHGPAVDYLDIAVWVSQDSVGTLALSDLLRQKLNDADMQQALGQVGGLLVAAPQAAAAVAAVGASAIIINTAYHLLRGLVGDSIGLYRTTVLAHEGFGAARHRLQHRVRAQDFSFGYSLEDVTHNPTAATDNSASTDHNLVQESKRVIGQSE